MSFAYSRTGIILVVENYEECVSFYRDLFGLPLLHQKVQGDFRLTCLEFGGSYLMIETGGVASVGEKSLEQSPSKLRFNVPDLEEALARVQEFGLEAQIETFDWGSAINITDPDGNRVGIRDEEAFERDSLDSE